MYSGKFKYKSFFLKKKNSCPFCNICGIWFDTHLDTRDWLWLNVEKNSSDRFHSAKKKTQCVHGQHPNMPFLRQGTDASTFSAPAAFSLCCCWPSARFSHSCHAFIYKPTGLRIRMRLSQTISARLCLIFRMAFRREARRELMCFSPMS